MTETQKPSKARTWRRLILRGAGVSLALLLIAGAGAALWVRSLLMVSLPLLDGTLKLPGLSAPVVIERDGMGVATLRAQNRRDLARATGFVHGQERFFQRDLLRRQAAGELGELLGPAALPSDRRVRVHRFRAAARARVGAARNEGEEHVLMDAYTEGVNVGLRALGEKPPEYLLLRSDPAPWLAEDSLLVAYAMYLRLQGGNGLQGVAQGL